MANDIDMWNDIEELEKMGKAEHAKDLHNCWNSRYNEYKPKLAEKLKSKFEKKWGYWGNWY